MHIGFLRRVSLEFEIKLRVQTSDFFDVCRWSLRSNLVYTLDFLRRVSLEFKIKSCVGILDFLRFVSVEFEVEFSVLH